MIRIPGRIPILIHPLFWLFSGLIGWLYTGSFAGILLWIPIIFISVLVHEFGHALTAVAFGQRPQIQLVALGGLTSYQGDRLKFWKQFLIVFNGPFFGILLCLLATLLLRTGLANNPSMYQFLAIMQVVNLFWSIVNLLPVLPLDGGQLMRIVLEAIFGLKGFKAALLIGVLVAVGISSFFFIQGWWLIGALFFLFAFQSFDLWRKSRFLSDPDRNDQNKQELLKGEMALQTGNVEEAKRQFGQIREKLHEGVIFVAATQYLAMLLLKEGDKNQAYDLLISIEKQLSGEPLCVLHKLAFEKQNYDLVAKHSSSCYQMVPSQDIALRNARAFAALEQPKPAGGWLQTAWKFGNLDLDHIINEDVFGKVKKDPIFVEFVELISKGGHPPQP